MTPQAIDLRRQKYIVLIGLTLFWFVSAMVNMLAGQEGPAAGVIFLLTAIGWGVGMLYWCKIDADDRNEQLSTGLQLAIVGFGLFALIYYLFKTRGSQGGVKAMGWLLLYASVAYLVVVALGSVALRVLPLAGISPDQ